MDGLPPEVAAVSENYHYGEDQSDTPGAPEETAQTALGDVVVWAIARPADVPYYMHPTWKGQGFCERPAILLQNVALVVPRAYAGPAQGSAPAPIGVAVASSNSNGTAEGGTGVTAEEQGVLAAYSEVFTLQMINTAWVPCTRPVINCTDPYDSGPCLLRAYAGINPDSNPAALAAGQAAAAQHRAAAGGGGGGGNYGVQVVLPAVLGAVGERKGGERS